MTILRASADDGTRDERGFTLIELMVSLTVLAIGLVGVIGVMNSSMGVTARTNERSRAVNLATREIESLRAVQYATLLPSATSDTRTEVVGGTTFTIEKAVTWGAATGNSTAVKNATVAVRWSAGGRTSEVSQNTTIYPGGLGPVAPSSTPSCGSGGTPSAPIAAGAGAPGILTDNAVDVTWTPPLTSNPAIVAWKIEMSTNSFVTSQALTSSHPVSSTTYRVEGLSSNTTYQFRVAGISACGIVSTWSPLATVKTLVTAVVTCTYGTPNVSPSAVERANSGNGSLSQSPVVTVNTSGVCVGLYVKYQAVAGTNVTTLLTNSNGVWSGTLSSALSWDVGVHTIDLFDGGNVKRGSLLLTVCAKNAKTC